MRRDKEKEREKNSLHTRANSSLASSHSSRNTALDLQRKAGNQAVLELLHSGAIQAKLRVSQPGDADELEADRMADQVVSNEAGSASQVAGISQSGKTANAAAVQRKCSCEGGATCPECEEDKTKGIHRKPSSSATDVLSAPDDLLQQLGPGRALDPDVRKSMESQFSHGFSGVRVHDDSRAAESARSVNARAFTYGRNIVFSSGEYSPHARDGRGLLAHELTHIVQQNSSVGARSQAGAAPVSGVAAPPRIRRKGAQPVPASEEKLVDITIGSEQFRGITRIQAIAELKRHWRRLHSGLEGDKEGHIYQKKIRDDQYIVGFFSDVLGGVSMPPLTIWEQPRRLLDEAKALLDAGDLENGLSKLAEAENAYKAAHARFVEYRDGTISGAERSVTVLKVTAAAGAVAATIATGGVAAEAGLGLLGTSTAIGVAGGTYGATQEFSGQVGEKIVGTRKSFDLAPILKRGATDAITNFVGAFAGGALSKYATRMFGSYLSKIGDAELIELGESLGMKGPLPRDFFLTRGQRLIADFLGGVGSTPLTTAVSIVVNRITGQEKIPSAHDFVMLVVEEMVKGGALQLFLGSILHARAGRVPTEIPGRAGAFAESVPVSEPAARATPTEPTAHAAAPAETTEGTNLAEHRQRAEASSKHARSESAPKETPSVQEEPAAPKTVEEYVKRFGPPKRAEAPAPEEGVTAQPREKTFREQRAEAVGEEGAPEVEAIQDRPTPGGAPEPVSTAAGKFAHNKLPTMMEHFEARGDAAKAAQLRKILAWPKGVEPNSPGSSRYTELTMPDGSKGIPDGIDWDHGLVHELKPNTETRYARRGRYQAQEYANAMNRDAIGGRTDWRPAPALEYDASALESLLRSWGVLPKLGGPSTRINLLK